MIPKFVFVFVHPNGLKKKLVHYVIYCYNEKSSDLDTRDHAKILNLVFYWQTNHSSLFDFETKFLK